MAERRSTVLSQVAAALALIAAPDGNALAQCDYEWQPIGDAVIFSDTPAAIAWDPDGDGPLPQWLATAGRPHVAAWDGERWQVLGDAFDERVTSLAVYRGELIAAGAFTHCGDRSISQIARWDGAAWQPLGGGVQGIVFSLTVYQDELIVGGYLDAADAEDVANLARWDGSAWRGFDNWNPFLVSALGIYRDELLCASISSVAIAWSTLEAGTGVAGDGSRPAPTTW